MGLRVSSSNNPVIVALDTPDLSAALELALALRPYVGALKCGLEFFTACGPDGVSQLKALGLPVFLDLKLHDIPNTVYQSAYQITALGVDMFTVHASGGQAMVEAAARGAQDAAKTMGRALPLVLAVTVLTSLHQQEVTAIGYQGTPAESVARLAGLALAGGAGGVVCSAQELDGLKKLYNNRLRYVVPGIRPAGADVGDQKRVMTPAEALKKGADHLVIGRPITQAPQPAEAAKAIFESLNIE